MTFGERKPGLTLARVVSALLSPPLVAGVTFLTLLAFDKPSDFVSTAASTLIFGTIGPLAVVQLNGSIFASSSSALTQSRTSQFVLAIGGYAIGSVLLSEIGAPRPVIVLMVCYLGNSIVMMLVSLRWKISVHASGVAGPSTMLTYASGSSWLPLFLLMIPVGWARIKEGAHTTRQVAAGAALTILTTWVQLRLLL